VPSTPPQRPGHAVVGELRTVAKAVPRRVTVTVYGSAAVQARLSASVRRWALRRRRTARPWSRTPSQAAPPALLPGWAGVQHHHPHSRPAPPHPHLLPHRATPRCLSADGSRRRDALPTSPTPRTTPIGRDRQRRHPASHTGYHLTSRGNTSTPVGCLSRDAAAASDHHPPALNPIGPGEKKITTQVRVITPSPRSDARHPASVIGSRRPGRVLRAPTAPTADPDHLRLGRHRIYGPLLL